SAPLRLQRLRGTVRKRQRKFASACLPLCGLPRVVLSCCALRCRDTIPLDECLLASSSPYGLRRATCSPRGVKTNLENSSGSGAHCNYLSVSFGAARWRRNSGSFVWSTSHTISQLTPA